MMNAESPNVFLVGAGPGSPGLLTLRAAEALAKADLVLYDQLVPRRLLDFANPAAEMVCVRDLPAAPGQVPAHPRPARRVGQAGQDRRPAQGRRPAGLRPRRGGGGGAA